MLPSCFSLNNLNGLLLPALYCAFECLVHPQGLNHRPRCPLVQGDQLTGRSQPLTRWGCGRKDSLASYSTPAVRRQCSAPPATLQQIGGATLLPRHVASRLLGPQDCQASQAGLASTSSSGVGAVKLSRHRTVLLGAHNMAMSELSPVPSAASSNPSSYPSPNGAGHTGRSSERPRGRQFLALTTVLQCTAYGARTKHPSPERVWLDRPTARYLHDRYACKGLDMKRGAGSREPWRIAPSARPRPNSLFSPWILDDRKQPSFTTRPSMGHCHFPRQPSRPFQSPNQPAFSMFLHIHDMDDPPALSSTLCRILTGSCLEHCDMWLPRLFTCLRRHCHQPMAFRPLPW